MLAWLRGLLFLVRRVFQVQDFFLGGGKHRRRERSEGKRKRLREGMRERGGMCPSGRQMERWGWFSTWPQLGFTQKPYSRPRFMLFPIIWIPRFALFCTLSPLKPYVFSPPQREIQSTQERKMDPSSSRPSFFPLYIPLSHLSSLSFSLSLGLKGLCFQRKRLHSMGERGRKKKKKIIQLFCVFLPNGSCLSHCFPHSHPYTPRAVAVSKSTAEHHMGLPHTPPPPSTVLPSHTPCPPGCLSSGLFGINELIHTAMSGSIPFAARAQCKQA